MKIELHCHTNRYSGCAANSSWQLMERFIECGYGAVFITEHAAVWQLRELAELQQQFPRIRVFGGVELNLGYDPYDHLLVLGSSDAAYLKLSDPAEILAKARAEGHMTVLAHPFRFDARDRLLRKGLLPDALEFRTCNHSLKQAQESAAAGQRYNLPLVNAGDTHALGFINRYWIETDQDIASPADLLRAIRAGAYQNCQAEE